VKARLTVSGALFCRRKDMAAPRPYAIYDIFTDQPFQGNSLAVVDKAKGLTKKQMQAIAREFNLSETVFIFPPDNAHHAARYRIFTPTVEMRYAGHPIIGASLYRAHQAMKDRPGLKDVMAMVEVQDWLIRVVSDMTDQRHGCAELDVPQLPQKKRCAEHKRRSGADSQSGTGRNWF
jgi:trans-2,3-dihydro-3-hydroxyanthranilate isomerase